jgi:broad specificity phosphatase PhoE
MDRIVFVTHPEVVIDPEVPVPRWKLSEVGRARMARFARDLAGRGVTAVWSSDERKATDGAEVLSSALGVPHRVDAALGENDRSSTGYLAGQEFWDVVELFFSEPDESVRGWETARAAQTRIVDAMRRVAQTEPSRGLVVVVSHGGVGRLLTAHLQGVAIGRESRPEHPGGGCWIEIDRDALRLVEGWRSIAD